MLTPERRNERAYIVYSKVLVFKEKFQEIFVKRVWFIVNGSETFQLMKFVEQNLESAYRTVERNQILCDDFPSFFYC